jgi:uroporphyrin-3 C-methyltransferase
VAQPAAPAAVTESPTSRKLGPTGILLIFALLALTIMGWQWYDSRTEAQQLRDELARRLSEGDARIKDAATVARESHSVVRELGGKVETLESGLAESQNQQLALEALYQQLSRGSDEWALVEIEQTLTIAAQQLQLAGNVRSALLALQNAEQRLSRIDRPQLAPIRKVIERDIERLRVAPHVDIVALTSKIDGLMASVDTLPLAMQQRPREVQAAPAPADDANMFMRFMRDIWQDVRALVRIQTVDRTEIPLIDPGQTFFLRENLRLRLLSARIALLQRDEKTFRSDVQAVRQWLERFYATEDRNVMAALAGARQLAEAQIGVDVPDISASLTAVRDYKLTREKSIR